MLTITAPGAVILAEELHAIEAAFANAWPPKTVTYLDRWQLQYSQGVPNRRTNSVLFLPGGPIDDFYGHLKGTDLGYSIESLTLLQAVCLEDVLCLCGPIDSVELIAEPTNSWLGVYMEIVKGQHEISLKENIINCIINDYVLAQISNHSAPLVVGIGVCEKEWMNGFCMRTLKLYRCQGYARRGLAALADWARLKCSKRLYLQVEQDNPTAQKIYQVPEFEIEYRYHYRTKENKRANRSN